MRAGEGRHDQVTSMRSPASRWSNCPFSSARLPDDRHVPQPGLSDRNARRDPGMTGVRAETAQQPLHRRVSRSTSSNMLPMTPRYALASAALAQSDLADAANCRQRPCAIRVMHRRASAASVRMTLESCSRSLTSSPAGQARRRVDGEPPFSRSPVIAPARSRMRLDVDHGRGAPGRSHECRKPTANGDATRGRSPLAELVRMYSSDRPTRRTTATPRQTRPASHPETAVSLATTVRDWGWHRRGDGPIVSCRAEAIGRAVHPTDSTPRSTGSAWSSSFSGCEASRHATC